MKLYIIEIEYLKPGTPEELFTKIESTGYEDLNEAINYITSRTDYQYSINAYLHVGTNHRYTIKEVNVKWKN